MNYFNSITSENFDQSFDLIQILTNSMFYPASGVDGFDIEHSSLEINSFIHVDYSVSESEVTKAMREDFKGIGYRLIGLKSIELEGLNVNGLTQPPLELNEEEKSRLEMDFIRDRFDFRNFTPFALWAVYELEEAATNQKSKKRNKFSLLHIGGEACDMFNQLFLANKVNPVGLTFKMISFGYGDNWTNFYDSESCLFKSMLSNSEMNKIEMPKFILEENFIYAKRSPL